MLNRTLLATSLGRVTRAGAVVGGKRTGAVLGCMRTGADLAKSTGSEGVAATGAGFFYGTAGILGYFPAELSVS